MAQEIIDEKQKDITGNWVTSSRFLFYVQVFCVAAFLLGGCYKLYNSVIKESLQWKYLKAHFTIRSINKNQIIINDPFTC
jgi:hypothetical protein